MHIFKKGLIIGAVCMLLPACQSVQTPTPIPVPSPAQGFLSQVQAEALKVCSVEPTIASLAGLIDFAVPEASSAFYWANLICSEIPKQQAMLSMRIRGHHRVPQPIVVHGSTIHFQ